MNALLLLLYVAGFVSFVGGVFRPTSAPRLIALGMGLWILVPITRALVAV